ncbi:MAG: hypothetical protein H6834_09060 [Planctomycetes bacterium]|nr:hypothetical protein [Planctomycetota bacterium]
MTRMLTVWFLTLLLGSPVPAQEESAPVTATFLLSPGEWTQEFDRLATHLRNEVRARGHEVLGSEAHAPNVIAITFRGAGGRTPSIRTLLPILRDPRMGAWPGLGLLGVQGDQGPLTLRVEGNVAFEVTRPADSSWDDEMIARKVFEKAYETRNGVAPSREVLETFQFEDVSTETIGGERVRVTGTFLYRHERFTAIQLDRILNLFLERPAIELRRVVPANGPVEAALHALDDRRALGEVNGESAFVDAAAQVMARAEATPMPYRIRSRLALVEAGSAPFGTNDFAKLTPTPDSQGHPALAWELTPEAGARFEHFTQNSAGLHLAYCIAGEAWAEIIVGSRLPGKGAIYGDFSQAKVDKVVRAFGPMNPPSTWTLTSVSAR